MGWDDIRSLLLRPGTGDIVTSLSIGAGFPDLQLALEAGTWSPALRDRDNPGELDAHWDQLADATQWDMRMKALRGQPGPQWEA